MPRWHLISCSEDQDDPESFSEGGTWEDVSGEDCSDTENEYALLCISDQTSEDCSDTEVEEVDIFDSDTEVEDDIYDWLLSEEEEGQHELYCVRLHYYYTCVPVHYIYCPPFFRSQLPSYR